MFGAGLGTPSPAQLGLKLVKRLPQSLTERFQVIILADTAFGSKEFLHGIRQLKYHAVTGVAISRKLTDGRFLRHLHKTWTTSLFSWFKFPCYRILVLLKASQLQIRKTFCFVYSTDESCHSQMVG